MLRTFTRLLGSVLKALCYAALAAIVAASLAMLVLAWTGTCPRLDEGAVECVAPIAEATAQIALAVILISAFTALPALMALVGLVLLVVDFVRWRRRRGEAPPA